MEYDRIGVNPFKNVVYNFKRRKIVSHFRNDIWGIDLMDMSKEHPSGYVLICIDYFTRYVRGAFMKHKSKLEFDNTMQMLLTNNLWSDDVVVFPKNIHSDLEKAFIYSDVLPQHEINIYHTEFMGSPICERAIRSIKEIMFKLLYEEQLKIKKEGIYKNVYWTHFVQDAINIYNNRVHRSIGMTPQEAWDKSNVSNTDETPILLKHVNSYVEKSTEKPKFKVGDKVVIANDKNNFKKSYRYDTKWGTSVFEVTKINLNDIITYKLSNGKNYYAQQLQLSNNSNS
jgi:hypothetical protein